MELKRTSFFTTQGIDMVSVFLEEMQSLNTQNFSHPIVVESFHADALTRLKRVLDGRQRDWKLVQLLTPDRTNVSGTIPFSCTEQAWSSLQASVDAVGDISDPVVSHMCSTHTIW